MTDRVTRIAVVIFAVWGASSSPSWAKDGSCGRCGGHQGVTRVCRPVTTFKYVSTNYWDFATQDFCIPRKCGCATAGRGCEAGTEPADGKKPEPGGAAAGDCHACGNDAVPMTRNRLLKKTCVTRVPVTVWVVEYVCEQCVCGEKDAAEPAAEMPAGETPPIRNLPAPNPFDDDPASDDPLDR